MKMKFNFVEIVIEIRQWVGYGITRDPFCFSGGKAGSKSLALAKLQTPPFLGGAGYLGFVIWNFKFPFGSGYAGLESPLLNFSTYSITSLASSASLSLSLLPAAYFSESDLLMIDHMGYRSPGGHPAT
jgi:hypothetical protein